MIVACDTYDWDDYPVFVKPSGDVIKEVERIKAASMQKIMEVYNLSMDREAQLSEHRAFNL